MKHALKATISRFGLFALILLLWEGVVRFNIIDEQLISSPGSVFLLIIDWIRTGFIWPHIGATLLEVLIGYALGTVLGLVIAFVFFFRPHIALVLDPFINLLNAIPRGVLAPLAVVAFGLGLLPKVILVSFVVLLITLVNVYSGLQEVNGTPVDSAKIMGAKTIDLVRHVYLPASVVWIVVAMRTSIGHAFTTAIICELLGASVGIGWIIAIGQSTIKADWIMAGLFFAAALSLIMDVILLAPLERKASLWKVL